MKLRNILSTSVSTVLAVLLCIGLFASIGEGFAASSTQGASSVSAVPKHPNAQLSDLPATQTAIGSGDAVTTALREYHLSTSDLDSQVGAVPALVSIRGDRYHQNIRAWIVTTLCNLTSPVGSTMYHHLVIFVDATTGQYVFAYPAA